MTVLTDVHTDFIGVVHQKFSDLMRDVEKAIMQMEEDKLFWTPNNHSNSVDIIIKHIEWESDFTLDGLFDDRW